LWVSADFEIKLFQYNALICAEFDLLSYTAENKTTINIVSGFPQDQVVVKMVLKRKSSYYTIMFVVPSILITTLALMGKI
jgi:hypothetical protein